jgi:CRISPR/Cas system type I-B associated protein Csh2 (Cas7 group RAMP superfamily)
MNQNELLIATILAEIIVAREECNNLVTMGMSSALVGLRLVKGMQQIEGRINTYISETQGISLGDTDAMKKAVQKFIDSALTATMPNT